MKQGDYVELVLGYWAGGLPTHPLGTKFYVLETPSHWNSKMVLCRETNQLEYQDYIPIDCLRVVEGHVPDFDIDVKNMPNDQFIKFCANIMDGMTPEEIGLFENRFGLLLKKKEDSRANQNQEIKLKPRSDGWSKMALESISPEMDMDENFKRSEAFIEWLRDEEVNEREFFNNNNNNNQQMDLENHKKEEANHRYISKTQLNKMMNTMRLECTQDRPCDGSLSKWWYHPSATWTTNRDNKNNFVDNDYYCPICKLTWKETLWLHYPTT